MKIVSYVTAAVLFFVLYVMLSEYLDRPTVEISVDTNVCVRAYGPKGPMSCAEAIERRHEIIYVEKIKNARTKM